MRASAAHKPTQPAVILLHRPRGPMALDNLTISRQRAHAYHRATFVINTTATLHAQEQVVAAIARQHPIEAILAEYEGDQESAARHRMRHHVPGPSMQVVERFRDKQAMHRTLQKGQPRAFVLPDCLNDLTSLPRLRAFAARHHNHIILKPQASHGARGVQELTSPEQLPAAWKALYSEAGRYRAEEYIETNETQWHIDSVVHNGQVVLAVPSRYTYFLDHYQQATLPGTVTHFHDHSPLAQRVRTANAEAIATLGLRDGITHCELFVRGGQLVFGEIAARMGGGPIRYLVRTLTGIDLCETAVDLCLDPTYGDRFDEHLQIARGEIGALLHRTPGPGIITQISMPNTLIGGVVVHAAVANHVGDRVSAAEHSSQSVGFSLVVGEDHEVAYRNLHIAQQRFVLQVVAS